MGEQAKQIVTAFQQMESFFDEMARFLLTADSLMKKAGWAEAWGSGATYHGSTSLNTVHKWLPWYFFRFFKRSDMSNIVPFVCVMIGDPLEKEIITEAIVTAGWAEHEEGFNVWEKWDGNYARAHVWMPDRNEEGRLCSCIPSKWDGVAEETRKVTTFGYPLDEIASAADLEQKIVQRLLNEIEQACKA